MCNCKIVTLFSAIEQEKEKQNLFAGIENFDTKKLKHTETQEKNPLPTKEGQWIYFQILITKVEFKISLPFWVVFTSGKIKQSAGMQGQGIRWVADHHTVVKSSEAVTLCTFC